MWIAVVGLVTSLLATGSGLYAGRNTRLKEREANQLDSRREEERVRTANLVELHNQLGWLSKRVRELEDEIRAQRTEHDEERRRLLRERDTNWQAFVAVYDHGRDARHAAHGVMQMIVAGLRERDQPVPAMLNEALPMPLPRREAFFTPQQGFT